MKKNVIVSLAKSDNTQMRRVGCGNITERDSLGGRILVGSI